MSTEKKPDDIELWDRFLEGEYEKMQEELKQISDPKLRSELRDQLIWLRQQMTTFEESQNLEAIQEDYEWIAKSFNQNLSPKQPFKHKP